MFGVDIAEGLLELGDVTAPLLVARGVDPGLDVEPDLDQPWELCGVDLLERAAQTGMLVGAGGGVARGANGPSPSRSRERHPLWVPTSTNPSPMNVDVLILERLLTSLQIASHRPELRDDAGVLACGVICRGSGGQ